MAATERARRPTSTPQADIRSTGNSVIKQRVNRRIVWAVARRDLRRYFNNPTGYVFVTLFVFLSAALIPVGMLASLATSNATIAFILGSLFCAVPIGVVGAAETFSASFGRRIATLGVSHHFRDFARGLVELPAVLYFVFLAAFFLYLNVVVLGRRHWPHDRASRRLWLHH